MPPRDAIPFYHYTSDKGVEGILKDGRIDISDPRRGDAFEGPGTYGTKYPPSTRTSTIARNNWDDGWKHAMEHGKMKNYVRCEVPREELKECRGHGGRKDGILVHPGGIDLSKYPTKFGRVGEHKVSKAFPYDPEAIRKAMYPDVPAQTKLCSQTKAVRVGTQQVKQVSREPLNNRSAQTSKLPSQNERYGSRIVAPPYPDTKATWGNSCGHSDDEPHHSGHNSAGNYYEAFADGSYRYENLDGSTYECDGSGRAVFTAPDGGVTDYSWPGDGQADSGDETYGDSYGCDDYGGDDGWDCGDDGGYDDDDYDEW